jgi:quercetin dioxygenase-like cupin family protein
MSQPTIVSRIENLGEPAIASWGEKASIRILRAVGDSNFCILDYYAPVGFAVPRHVHHVQDEVLEILEGSIAVWTPEWCGALRAKDIVSLPAGVPHAWRSIDKQAVHFTVTLTPGGPGGLKDFWQMVQQRGLTLADVSEIAAAAEACGMTITGPPLTDAEVLRYTR